MNSPAPPLPRDLPEDLRDRLQRAGAIPASPRGALQRVRLRLEATLRWNPSIGMPTSGVPVAGLRISSAGVGWLLGVGALVLGATTTVVLTRHPVRRSIVDPSPQALPASVETLPSPQEVPAHDEVRVPAPTAEPARVARPLVRPRPASVESSRAFDDRLASESRLLDLARVALAEGDFHRSLAALEQHRRTFPEGQLLPQREALRIEALIAAQDYPSALAAANSFRHRFPDSLLKLKIDRLIRGLPDEWQEE